LRRTLLFILILAAACGRLRSDVEEEEPIIAQAYGAKLYLSEANQILPRNISSQDSANLVQNYINKWVQQQILLHNAIENLNPEEQDFSRQLDEYRNSLLLYSYEKKLIRENLDTVVTDAEIQQYYNDNRSQFELKGNIVKFDFVKLVVKSKFIKDFRRMLKPGNVQDSTELLDACQKHSTDYWLADEWVFLQDLLDVIPLNPDNEEHFLRRTTFTETKDDDFVYLLRINDFKTTDSIPPLAFERENIMNIIINSRKLDLLERLRQKDIDDAFMNNEAEIFNNQIIQ